MIKVIIAFCALVACTVARPSVLAPLVYSTPTGAAAYTARYAASYSSPLAYTTIRQKYNVGVVLSTPVATPLTLTAPPITGTPLAQTQTRSVLAVTPSSHGLSLTQGVSGPIVTLLTQGGTAITAVPLAGDVPLNHVTPADTDNSLDEADSEIDAAEAGNPLDETDPEIAVEDEESSMEEVDSDPVVASLAPTASLTPVIPTAVATPLAFTNVPLDAAYASSRVDINQNYNTPIVTAISAPAPAPVDSDLGQVAATAADFLKHIVPFSAVTFLTSTDPAATADPLANDNSTDVDAPLADPTSTDITTPITLTTSTDIATPLAHPALATVGTPLAFANTPLTAGFASNRVDIYQNYNAPVVPAISTTASGGVAVATPLTHAAPTVVVVPFSHVAPPSDVNGTLADDAVDTIETPLTAPTVADSLVPDTLADTATTFTHAVPTGVDINKHYNVIFVAPHHAATLIGAVAAPVVTSAVIPTTLAQGYTLPHNPLFNSAATPLPHATPAIAPSFALATPAAIGTPLAFASSVTNAAPLAPAVPPTITSPLAYANTYLDAGHASNRVDINQIYNTGIVSTTFPTTPISTGFTTIASGVTAPINPTTLKTFGTPLVHAALPGFVTPLIHTPPTVVTASLPADAPDGHVPPANDDDQDEPIK